MPDPIQPQGAPVAPPEFDPDAPMAPDGVTATVEQTATDLDAQLQAALAESSQIKDALLRALADSENMRRRAQTDLANAYKYAIEGFAANLLPVKDTLEMALADQASTIDQIKLGVDLTLKNLAAAFDKAKVIELNPLNQKFDPNRHQAVSQVESDQPANTVVQVFQKGYVLQDRVLRPAMVAVARPKGAAAPQGEQPVESQGQ
jgi:molecular chaperone GrpE